MPQPLIQNPKSKIRMTMPLRQLKLPWPFVLREEAAVEVGAAAQLQAAGVGVLLLADEEWALHARFYQQYGFARLERIVYYQLSPLRLPQAVRRALPALTFTPVGPDMLPVAVALDHAAFP